MDPSRHTSPDASRSNVRVGRCAIRASSLADDRLRLIIDATGASIYTGGEDAMLDRYESRAGGGWNSRAQR